jgi:hypothetical protein
LIVVINGEPPYAIDIHIDVPPASELSADSLAFNEDEGHGLAVQTETEIRWHDDLRWG